MILVAAAWLALVVVSRVDELFFPEGISALPPIPGVESSNGDEGRLNILVMGLDRRAREGDEATRTDTMFVLTIDKGQKTAGILGIPRDSWVEIPYPDGDGYFEERINTAYPTGEEADYSGGGPAVAREVVEHNLGIPIDYHVIIDFEGFVEIIDELGGIDIYVAEEINDPTYSETELPGDYDPIHLEVGDHHMDGATALKYSRTRYDSSDLDRIQRQQQVIFAAIDKALERRLVSVGTMVDLWGQYKDTIDTDINDLQAPGFASLAAQIDPSRIAALSLGSATTPWTVPETGAQVLLVDKERVQELVDAIFGSEDEFSSEAALVEVQNGAGLDGLAAIVVEYLGEFGFDPASLTATDGVDGVVELTTIVDYTDNETTVDRLAGLLGVSEAQVRQATAEDESLRTVNGADVVVVLGADAQARDFSVDTSGG